MKKILLIIILVVVIAACKSQNRNSLATPARPTPPTPPQSNTDENNPLNSNSSFRAVKLPKQNSTFLKELILEPACVNGENGVEIFYEILKIPTEVIFQIKEQDHIYENAFRKQGLFEDYTYFSICNDCDAGDYSLEPDKVYILRMEIKYPGTVEYSAEQQIDTRNTSNYIKKECKKEKIILQRW